MTNRYNTKINLPFIKQVIIFIASIVILWSAIITINSLYVVIKYVVTEKLFDLDNLIIVQHKIARVHGSILMTPIFLAMIMLCTKKMKIWHLALAIIMGFNFDSYQFFDNVIHPFLYKLHIFDFLLRSGQTVVNPQYTKILFYLVLLLGLTLQSIIKKYRSVDRIFMTLILSVVLGTTVIFHFAIPMGMFKIGKKDLEYALIEKVKYEPKNILCEKKECFTLNSDLQTLDPINNEQEKIFKNYSFFIKKVTPQLTLLDPYFSISLGNFQGQGFDYIITVLQKTPTGYFLVYDKYASNKLSRHSEIWFSFLSTCAHFFWLYGGIGLLFLHKNVMFRKLSPRLNK